MTNPSRSYFFTRADLLVDGLNGTTTNYFTGRWIGFKGEDLVLVIDMKEPTPISEVLINSAVTTGDWVFDICEIIVEACNDDSHYIMVTKDNYTDDKTENWNEIVSHELKFD